MAGGGKCQVVTRIGGLQLPVTTKTAQDSTRLISTGTWPDIIAGLPPSLPWLGLAAYLSRVYGTLGGNVLEAGVSQAGGKAQEGLGAQLGLHYGLDPEGVELSPLKVGGGLSWPGMRGRHDYTTGGGTSQPPSEPQTS